MVVFQLISVPVCLKFWGQETYGSWLALYAAFMLVRSLDVGFVTYVGNQLNYLYHQDVCELRAHLASALTGIAIIGMIQLAIGLAAIFSDHVVLFLGLTSDFALSHRSGVALLVLISTWALSGSYLGIVHRLMIPAGLMYQAAWWGLGVQVGQFVGIILAAILHFDMLETSLLFAFLQFSIYFASVIYIRGKLPELYPWWKGLRIRTGLNDLRYSMMLTVSNMIQQGTSNGIVLIVSSLAGPAAVPVFTTIRTLTNLWNTATNVLTTPLLPDVVRFYAKGEPQKLLSMTVAHWVLVGSFINWGVMLTYPLLPLLYSYWTGHNMLLDKGLLALLLGSVVVANVGAMMLMYLNGINSLRIVMVVSLVRGILGLGGGMLAYRTLGLVGFGLGILLGELLVLLVTGYYFVRHELINKGIRMPPSALISTALGAASVLLFLLGDGFAWFSFDWSWPISFAGVMAASLWGWSGLDPAVKHRLLGLLPKRIFSRDIG